MQETNEDSQYQNNRNISVSPIGMKFTVELNETIKSNTQFNDLNNILRNCTPNDVVELIINGSGGVVSATVQLINNIRSSAAQVHCILDGEAHSAHSMIFLSGDRFSIGDNCSMLIHDGQGGMGESHAKLHKYMDHSKKATERLFKDVYERFLSKEEVTLVLSGTDIWLSTEEIKERLETKVKLQHQEKLDLEEEQPCGDLECLGCNGALDIVDILEDEHSDLYEHTEEYTESKDRNK